MVAPPRAYNKSKSPEVLDQDVDEDNFDDEETIDEFIKKHLDEDKKDSKTDFNNRDFDNLSGSDDPSESSMDQSGLTPKQALLTALLRLSEAIEEGNTYQLTLSEKELFIQDLESILKVLTFKETCLLVFPCLEAFAIEQDYLKIELFRQLPHVFKKVMKTKARVDKKTLSNEQLLDIMTVNVFPLISQLLMLSDEPV